VGGIVVFLASGVTVKSLPTARAYFELLSFFEAIRAERAYWLDLYVYFD